MTPTKTSRSYLWVNSVAYSQYNTYCQLSDGTALADGEAALNSSLSSPLSGSGLYCRRYPHNSTAGAGVNSGTESKTLIKSSVKYGWFYDTPADINLSLRARVRIGIVSGSLSSSTNAYMGVCALAPEPAGGLYSGGYELVLQATSGVVRLVLRTGNPLPLSGATNITQPGANNTVVCTGAYALNAWYHIRLDVLAASATERQLVAYTSSDNGTNWQEVGSCSVADSDPAWRITGRAGYTSLLAQTGPIFTSHFIEDFAAYAE